MKKEILTPLIGLSLIFSSCNKEGCTDINAANYSSKAKTDNGKCIYQNKTNILTVFSSEWSGNGVDGYIVTKPCSIITQSIYDKGAVMVYLKTDDTYVALPYSMYYGSWTTHLVFEYRVGQIIIFTRDSDEATINPGTVDFKIVAIESSAIEQNPNVDLNDYESVVEAFNL